MAVDSSCGNSVASSPAERDLVSDSANGKTCHQCRQKIRDFSAACKNQRNNKPCLLRLCRKCLLNRYGENAEEVNTLGEWSCPKCRGICNCSVCMKKRGHQPTGVLINTAKATGFSSVSEMLLKGTEHINYDEKVGAAMVAPLEKEAVISPRNKGKENSFDGKVDANLPNSVGKCSKKFKGMHNDYVGDNTSSNVINQDLRRETNQEGLEGAHGYIRKAGLLSDETSLSFREKKSRKMKCNKTGETSNGKHDLDLKGINIKFDEKKSKKSRRDGLEENVDSTKKGLTIARCTSSRKFRVSKKMSSQGDKVNGGVDLEEKVKDKVGTSKMDLAGTFDNKRKKEHCSSTQEQNADFHADILQPVGTELTSVAGIDVRAEDIGNALQFLEFCSVFGKILEVRKGQPEHVLQDLLHGRTGRRGKFSLTVQFHIHLLSIIQRGQGKRCESLSPTYGKNSWFYLLKKCLSEVQSVLKAQGLDSLEKADDYETLDASEKLRVLNILCDEVLGTEKVRNWIDEQNMEFAQKVREVKQKVRAAKHKDETSKRKIKGDTAKNIISGDVASLPVSEQEAVSHIESDAAQAYAKVLESKDLLSKTKKTSDAVRMEPFFINCDGHAYWKLNCSRKYDLLHQNLGKGDTLAWDEKWFTLDAEGKEVIEKHISFIRRKKPRGA